MSGYVAGHGVAEEPIKPARKLVALLIALAYLLGAALLALLIDRQTLREALSLPLSLLAGLIVLSLLNFALRALRWVLLGRHMGFDVPLLRNGLYYLAGFSLTATPGKAGEAVRLWLLKRHHGVPWMRSIPVMVADRLIDMWSVLMIAIASMAGTADYLWQAAIPFTLLVLVSLPILFAPSMEPVLRVVYALMPHRGRVLVQARHVLRAMHELASWRTYGLLLIPSMAGWLMHGVAFYLLLAHFGVAAEAGDAVFVYSFALVAGAISMMPGGVGGAEAAMVLLLRGLGADLHTALVITAISRVTTFWFAVGLGVVLLPFAKRGLARPPDGATDD